MIENRLPQLDCELAEKEICDFLRREVRGRGVVIGLSGGVDSAVVTALSVKALGRRRVLALIMPEAGVTPDEDTDDAKGLAKQFGIDHRVIDIMEPSKSVIAAAERTGSKVAEGNIKARLRMIFLYYFANMEGRLVVGSSDRSELLIGYFTKHGDGGADLLPLGALFKSQVRELANRLGIPSKIIQKKSSPRLWADQTAEGELGLCYEEIDVVLHLLIDRKLSAKEVSGIMGPRAEAVVKINKMIRDTRHKRRMPRIPKLKLPGQGGGSSCATHA